MVVLMCLNHTDGCTNVFESYWWLY